MNPNNPYDPQNLAKKNFSDATYGAFDGQNQQTSIPNTQTPVPVVQNQPIQQQNIPQPTTTPKVSKKAVV